MLTASQLIVSDAKSQPSINSSHAGLVLQRKCACGSKTSTLASECECKNKKNLQTKLTIGASNDPLEHEADRIADQVVSSSSTDLASVCSTNMASSSLQRQSTHVAVEGAEPLVTDAISSSGQPLDGATRAFMESRFGHDFSLVRVHSGAAAERSAREVNALAYTVGGDIVFGAGEYAPHTESGRRLLSHELTHVVQQDSGTQSNRLQRYPLFTDGTCEDKEQEKIIDDIDIALKLVRQAVTALSEPKTVAGPLKSIFHIDIDQPGQVEIALPILQGYLSKVQKWLEDPVESHCVSGKEADGARAFATADEDTGLVITEDGITYNRNVFNISGTTLRLQVVNTIIHEYAHLAGLGHGEPAPGDPVLGENSLKTRGLDEFEAMNHAENYVRFVRAVN
jgi:uncharacterized protein DUF4157